MNERRQKNGGAQTEGQTRCLGRGNIQRLTLNAQRSKFNLGDGLGGSPGSNGGVRLVIWAPAGCEWRCQARYLVCARKGDRHAVWGGGTFNA